MSLLESESSREFDRRLRRQYFIEGPRVAVTVDLGTYLVVTGLVVAFVALAFEFLSLHLSGLAVGVGFVVVGFLLLATGALLSEFLPADR